ncbi:cilium assembly protein DZIP1L [Trichomycterus rosablanca]|uniref:cilium assembly protein DZIP1L n=1 Tax=Trichomycterus rosablanca TaxID=2290929 RepID=UPI002F34F72A
MLDVSPPPSPSWSASPPAQPFRFRARTEPLDWRRVAALDLDRVVRELDIQLLQEFIGAVTFCDVEGERCPQCRRPIDATLLKVLRTSQLGTEYLLHCQDHLSSRALRLEDRLQGALSLLQRREEERARLQKQLDEVRAESRRRKKLIATQQQLLQTSAGNYHKCQFCEKCFVNYSYLQAHVQRRHPEITDAEKQKRKQVELMEDGIEELKQKLRLTQTQLEAERDAETHRRQQDLEEQRRREAAEREEVQRWKEEERRRFQQDVQELKQLFILELNDVANKSSVLEGKLQELENRELKVSDLRGEDEQEKERRNRELKEQIAQKESKWRKKLKEIQNRFEQEREELQSENVRLQKALSVEESSVSSVFSLQQQVQSLSHQLREKNSLIHSQNQQIKKLGARSPSGNQNQPPTQVPVQDSPVPEEEEEEERKRLEEQRRKLLRGKENLKNLKLLLQEKLQEKLEEVGLRKGTKGISSQTLSSLNSLISTERVRNFRSRSDLHNLRRNLEIQLNQRVRELQSAPSNIHTSAEVRKKLQTPPALQNPKHRPITLKPQTPLQPPTAAPRSTAPPQSPGARVQQKRTSTPPFSDEDEDEEESDEDSAHVTKPVQRTSTTKQQKAESDLDWSDSDDSDASDSHTAHRAPSKQGTVVETLSRSLEKQRSSTITRPAGGVRVLPPSSQPSPPRPSIMKQHAVSEDESDLDLSSIEELIPLPPVGRGSTDVCATSGTSVWSSVASRPGAW